MAPKLDTDKVAKDKAKDSHRGKGKDLPSDRKVASKKGDSSSRGDAQAKKKKASPRTKASPRGAEAKKPEAKPLDKKKSGGKDLKTSTTIAEDSPTTSTPPLSPLESPAAPVAASGGHTPRSRDKVPLKPSRAALGSAGGGAAASGAAAGKPAESKVATGAKAGAKAGAGAVAVEEKLVVQAAPPPTELGAPQGYLGQPAEKLTTKSGAALEFIAAAPPPLPGAPPAGASQAAAPVKESDPLPALAEDAPSRPEGKRPVRDDTAPSRHSMPTEWTPTIEPVLMFNCASARCAIVSGQPQLFADAQEGQLKTCGASGEALGRVKVTSEKGADFMERLEFKNRWLVGGEHDLRHNVCSSPHLDAMALPQLHHS